MQVYKMKKRHFISKVKHHLFPALKNAAESGWLLMACAILAIVSANSEAHEIYQEIIYSKIGDVKVLTIIDDFLMALFFMVVGIEVKHELLKGHLSDPKQRLYPVVAAISGVAIPALIYAAFNYKHDIAIKGWAIPSATDIAFTLGIISILKKYISKALKVLVTTIAVVDDIIAVAIITIFYTQTLDLHYLVYALLCCGSMLYMNHKNVRFATPYIIAGALLWFCTLKSGVHATIAGVIIGLIAPSETGHKIEKYMSPVCVYLVLPLFALFNSGIRFIEMSLPYLLNSSIFLGTTLGLLIGKPLGIYGSLFALSKTRWSAPPHRAHLKYSCWLRQFYAVLDSL